MTLRNGWLAFCLSLLTPWVLADDRPVVVSSIKPLQMLVRSIAGEDVDSRLLVPPAVSPHQFQLRLSDRVALERAAAIFWVGPALERFLENNLERNTRAHALWQSASGNVESDHRHHGVDAHIWLDYDEVRRMAVEIRDHLSRALPGQREHFQQRADTFLQALAELDAGVAEQLQALAARPYLLMHDAYGYFERRYGLRRAGAVSVSPEQLPGLRHITTLRRRLQSGEIACVFREPQYQPELLDSLLKGVDVQVLTVDPLGVHLGDDADFLAFYRQLADSFAACH